MSLRFLHCRDCGHHMRFRGRHCGYCGADKPIYGWPSVLVLGTTTVSVLALFAIA